MGGMPQVRYPPPPLIEIPAPLQAVYGTLNVIEGLDSFTDVMENTRVGPWYRAMKEEVIQSKGTTRRSR